MKFDAEPIPTRKEFLSDFVNDINFTEIGLCEDIGSLRWIATVRSTLHLLLIADIRILIKTTLASGQLVQLSYI